MTGKTFLAILIAAIVAGFGAGTYVTSQKAARQAAADQALLGERDRTIEALKANVARLDTVWLVQTDTFRVFRQRWDTLRQVERFTDTLIHRDTLRLVVAVADSTIQACTDLLGTCDQQKMALRSIIRADSAAVRALSRSLSRERIKSRFGCTAGPSVNQHGASWFGASCGVTFRLP